MNIKAIALCAVVYATTLSAFGQGTTSFHAVIDGPHAVPPNSSTREAQDGTFTLQPNLLFSGSMGVTIWGDVTSVAIFRSTSQSAVGTHLYDFTPGLISNPGPGDPGGREFDFTRTLTSAEASDLASGFWWVNVITPGFPNGELRGQITAVPEPSVYALLTMGFAALLMLAKRRQNA